jgi:hypothetical protein
LHEALQLVEKKSVQNIENKRMENGKVVSSYIKLLEKKEKENINQSVFSNKKPEVLGRESSLSKRVG